MKNQVNQLRNIGDAGVITKPEGSVKISVLNNSRQIDVVVAGAGKDGKPGWMTMKVLPESGLPKGINYLDEAINPAKNMRTQKYGGQVLHVDQAHVYQFGPKGLVKHDKNIFAVGLQGKEPIVGRCYEVNYVGGQGKLKGELTIEQGRKMTDGRGLSR